MKGAAYLLAMVLLALPGPLMGDIFRRPLERVASMDPLRTGDTASAQAVALVYETPLEVDYVARPYRLKSALCALPHISSNRLEYTFKLRPGSRFVADKCFGVDEMGKPQGRAVEARDLVYSLKRLGDKQNASVGMWLMNDVADVAAPTKDTVRITLKKPLHVFSWFMAMPPTAVVPHEAVEFYGARFGGVAVGSGAYKLTSWRRNHAMAFTRNAMWPGWKNAPDEAHIFEGVEYYVVDDVSTQWLMFLSGEVDFLGAISRDNWDAVMGGDGNLSSDLQKRGIRLFSFPSLSTFYVGVNMKDPILGPNKKLRQALNCAFDFPAWQRFLNGRVEVCDGPLPPGIEGKVETPFAYRFNLEKAKRLLAEAGYPDGIDPKTGRRLVLPIALGRAAQSAREQAELLQSFYERIGIRLVPKYMTWNAYLKAVNDGLVSLFFLAWVADYPDAENFLQLFYSPNVSPGPNHMNYVNPAFDRAYEAAMACAKASARLDFWRTAQEIIREDCPWIFLHFVKMHTLAREKMQGYVPGDFPYGEEKYLRCK